MTIDERPGPGSTAPSSVSSAPASERATPVSSPAHVPNLEAQRAYAASIAPPPKPALPAAMTSRARLAGGVGGAMMLVGFDLAMLGVLLLVLPLVVEPFVRWLGSLLPDADPAAAGTSVEQLFGGPWPWIAALVLVVGLAALAIGTAFSIRTLRGARFPRPVRLTLAAFGIALGVRIVLNVFTAPFSSLLSPLLERGVAGIAVGGMEAVGTVVALVIACGMNVAIAAATGMVTWWFLANATRPAAPAPEPVEPSWTAQLKVHHIPH